MSVPLWVWITVLVAIAAIFVVSLIFGRKAHEIAVAEAATWVSGYVALAGLFGLGIWLTAGGDYAGQFFAGYVTEYALSVDNLFVFAIILTAFRVPRPLQGKVVLIGIGIALLLRGGLIAAGAALIHSFSWIFYLFGAFLLVTGVNLLRSRPEAEPEEPASVRLLRRVMPMSPDYVGGRFLVRHEGRRVATPLLAVIVALGVTDVVFALDSIPAIFGLTKEGFLVFTANAFALLGLSEMYFLLGALLDRLRFLGKGLAVILLFIGVKLVFEAMAGNSLPFLAGGKPIDWAPEISPGASLIVVGSVLAVTVIASAAVSAIEQRRRIAAARQAAGAVGEAEDIGGAGREAGGFGGDHREAAGEPDPPQ